MSFKSSRGFTLLELLVATGLMILIVGMVVVVARGGLMRMGTFAEAGETNERSLNLTARMSADVENAGLNMTRRSTNGVGNELLSFLQSAQYSWTPGNVRKLSASGWNYVVYGSRGLGSGVGSFTLTPPYEGSSVHVYGPDGVTSYGFAIGFGSWMGIYENGVEVASTYGRPANQTIIPQGLNTTYTFSVERASATSTDNIVRLYRKQGNTTYVLWTYSRPVSAYPLHIYAALYYQSNEITNWSVTGAPVIDNVLQQPRVAPMPTSADGDITLPVFLHRNATTNVADGFTVFRGDPTTDVVRLENDFDASGQTQLTTTIPARGSFAAGEKALLVDYAANHSLLLYVTASTVNGSTRTVTVRPITSSNSVDGWNGLFWSKDQDRTYMYPAGSVLIKLAPPVEYRWDGVDTLFRREGDAPWSIAASGVSDFQLSETSAPDSYNFRVTARLLSDNAFTSSDRTTNGAEFFDATFAPRALNSAYRH